MMVGKSLFISNRVIDLTPSHKANSLTISSNTDLIGKSMSGTNRSDIKKGLAVSIVLKQDQRSGNLTDGIVKDILTNSPNHPHGIKVRLESGDVGRVKVIND